MKQILTGIFHVSPLGDERAHSGAPPIAR